MADHNPQHGRRPNSHRGRRGTERRGSERRSPQREHAPESGARESARENGIDVEQIMRDLRARIHQRHGIELSNQQIQELAGRRLEAILEPRNVKPQLLEQLRKSAGAAPEIPASAPLDTYEFEETTLYETHRGLLRFFRKLLHPILKLFFNPAPLISALNTQARINKALAARELERERRQSEWNALQYELVQRVVVETSRISIEIQALSARTESLSAKVDFNERRVRGLESVPAPSTSRPAQRQHHEPAAPSLPAAEAAPVEASTSTDGAGEARRRRRRRRGRRGGGGVADAAGAASVTAVGEDELDTGDGPETDDDESVVIADSSEAPADAWSPAPTEPRPTTAQPVSLPMESVAPVDPVPSPPRDEPTPEHPVDRADPGPVDR